MVVERGQLDRRVQGGSGGAADEERRIQSPRLHLAADFLHLEQGRGNQSAYADEGGMMLFGGLQDRFLVHHHAQVHHIESVAAEDDARDILADVMDIPLDRRVNDDRALRRLFSGVHIGLQNGDGILHHLGGFHHLRQEHLAGAEAFSDFLHSRHQRPLNDLYG